MATASQQEVLLLQELYNQLFNTGIMNNNGKIILALLTGVAAGAALGIMTAPASGKETRKQLSGSAKKMADTLKEKVQNGLGALAALKATAADTAGGMSSPSIIGEQVKQHV